MVTLNLAVVSRTTPFANDQGFFVRLAVVIAVGTLLCFGQLVVRGLIDPRVQPIWVHAHALTMVGWLAIFITQNVLATGNASLHRKIGWGAAAFAFAIVALGWLTVFKTFQMGRSLPGYDDAYFITQTGIESTAFLGMVLWAIVQRNDTQSHRRLMLGATIVATINPALSRLLPVSIAGDPRSGWGFVVIEFALLMMLMRHDRKVLGTVHPATIQICAVLIFCQLLMIAGAYVPAVGAFAEWMKQA